MRTAAESVTDPVRVVIAMDSTTVREALVETCRRDAAIVVVGEAADGVQAVRLAKRLRPALVLMAVRLPLMDGLEATKEIMREAPTPIVMVTVSASAAEVEAGLSALRFGALTVLPAPTGAATAEPEAASRRLLDMIKALADVKVIRRRGGTSTAVGSGTRPRGRLIAVAASTGGPPALCRFLQELPADLSAPVVVVQHIIDGFLPGLVRWLRSEVPFRVSEVADGEALAHGTVYLAPSGAHLEVTPNLIARLTTDPPVAGFRPSATVLFQSLARSFGPRAIGVVLTGMGEDGLHGARALRDAGALVLAQDRHSSVVYGMPRVVEEAGLADVVGPVDTLAAEVAAALMGRTR